MEPGSCKTNNSGIQKSKKRYGDVLRREKGASQKTSETATACYWLRSEQMSGERLCTWREEAETANPEPLLVRRENYSADALPYRILYLTAGVDVQDDRFEIEMVGWRQDTCKGYGGVLVCRR